MRQGACEVALKIPLRKATALRATGKVRSCLTESRAKRVRLTALTSVLAAALSSCATLQLQRPLEAPVFPAQEYIHKNWNGVDIGVRPLVKEDEYLRLFDDDLPKIGVVALYVEVMNEGRTNLAVDPGSWFIRVGGRRFPALSVTKLFERYYSAHHIRMYSAATDSAARMELDQSVLKKGSIGPAGILAGFVFFRMDPGMAAAWDRDATLVARGLLADHRSATMEIALTHANP
jgi:hypothetical protein